MKQMRDVFAETGPLRARKWLVLSVASLGLGGAFAFLVGMARAPFAERLLPHDYFRHALVGHVNLAIVFWLLLSAVVLWAANFRGENPRAGFPLALLGTALVAFSALFGSGEAVLNNYVPVLVNPLFFAGLAVFFAGFSISSFGRVREAYDGLSSDDMVKNGLSTAVFVSAVLFAAVVVSSFFFAGKANGGEGKHYYEKLFWTPGHIQQFLNGSLLVAAWYTLARTPLKGGIRFWGFLKTANKSLIFSAALLLALLFFLDPADRRLKIGAEIIYGAGLGIPLFLHIANITRQTLRTRFDYKSPQEASLAFSMVIYLFGVFIAYAGFQNDTRVPAHYHGGVTALTLALMGCYHEMLKKGGREIRFERLARVQPYVYGTGMLLFIAGLFVSGLLGAPRKTPGVGFTENPVVLFSLGLMGVGTLLAVLGGAAFVLYAAATLVNGRRGE
ncbi:MAG: cbb3-type cytochrome c oxidase subunit I [Nitrospinae bacterium]|nr:cbb3-type cytochrome c oxidase subunit I [Nitrospinota bacterium]